MKSDENNHLRFGIEAYAFAREYVYKAKDSDRIKAGDLYLFLDEIHSAIISDDFETRAVQNYTDTKTGEKIRKRYNPYLELFKKKYKVDFNFQDKTLDAGFESNRDRLHSICKDYLSEFCYFFSDESLRIAINNWEPPADLLYFLVVVRYAIKFQFPIAIDYRKLMQFKSKPRSILPKLITIQDNNLGLIAYDRLDKSTKSFLLSRISNLHVDFPVAFRSRPEASERPAPFNYAEYVAKNPSAKYKKLDRAYEITMSKNNLDLLLHSKLNTNKIKVLSEEKGWAKIVITTHDEWSVFDMLFNYETYARLTGPPDAVDRFTGKLQNLALHYKSDKASPKKSK